MNAVTRRRFLQGMVAFSAAAGSPLALSVRHGGATGAEAAAVEKGVAAFAGSTVARTSGMPWVTKMVHGYRIALVVESVPGTAPSTPDPKHMSVLDHRLIVKFTDERTGADMTPSNASVDVAELGYKGVAMPLQRVESGKNVFYEARLRLSTTSPHRILVHATPVRAGRTLEAQFEYQHHH